MPKNNRILVIGTTDIRGGAAQVGWSIGQYAKAKGTDLKYIVSRKYSDKSYVKNLDSNNLFDLPSLLRHLKTFLSGSDIDTGHEQEILTSPWYKAATVVHCHNLHGNYFRLNVLQDIAKSKKLIWTLHDAWAILPDVPYGKRNSPLDYPPMAFPKIKYLIQTKKKIISKLTGTLVVPSTWLYDAVRVRDEFKGFDIKIIKNGIDLDVFRPKYSAKIYQKYDLDDTFRYALFVGNINDMRKGWQYINKLISVNKDIHVLVVGSDGRDTSQVKYFGSKSPEELSDIINISHYLLAPSLDENASLTIMQSMACGTPIIAFQSGGIPEQIVHTQTGYLTSEKSSLGLLDGINWISKINDSEYQRITKKCREYAIKYFDEKKMQSSYYELYQQ